MCRELRREPAWVGAIRLALTQGQVTTPAVIEEANLRSDVDRTVDDVLRTMAERNMLVEAPDFETSGRYLIGPVLQRSAPAATDIDKLSDRAAHRWNDDRRTA